jgi:hypothetical protein
MVYPHSNEIGKEKPAVKEPPSWAKSLYLEEEMKIISGQPKEKKDWVEHYWNSFNQLAYQAYGVTNPTVAPEQSNKSTISMLDELMQKLYSTNHVHVVDDPVLIEGPKGGFKFYDENPLPSALSYKVMRVDMRIDGLPMKDNRLGFNYVLPDKELTENELRALLKQQFQAVENMIINNIKKAKGIK